MLFRSTLYNSNITFDSYFFTFSGSFICFSNLMVPLSHSTIPTSNLTVLLSHIVVPLFFFKFDGSIVTLSSTNIASDYIFVTFSGTYAYPKYVTIGLKLYLDLQSICFLDF